MERTIPAPVQEPSISKAILLHPPVGELTGVMCERCGNEIRGKTPERNTEVTCSHCVLILCENPKAKEMAGYKSKEGEKRAREIHNKTGRKQTRSSKYGGERVVDRFRRLQAEKQTPKMRRMT